MTRWLIALVVAGMFGCQAEQKPEFVEVDLEDKAHRRSYALGMNLSEQLKKQGVEINLDVFLQGFKDDQSGEATLMTSEDALNALIAMQEEQRADMQAAQNKQAEENKKKGEEFLAQNKSKPGVVTLESGLQYEVMTAGSGPKPEKEDTVVCHYRGTLLDGSEFDSSHERGEPATFPVGQLIPGWVEALQLMPVGSKWKLYVPHYLAYGARNPPGIGPNSTLIFEMELLEIK